MNVSISIIMTVYNREKYVGEALTSVLKQTRRDFELLVWDDCSTDDSVAIAKSISEGDPRVRIVRGEHSGFSKCLEQAISRTRGRYIGWVDSDDILAPTALAETARVLDCNRDVGLVYTNYLLMDENSRIKGEGDRCKIPYSKERILSDFMTFHFRLIRRSMFDRVGGINTSFIYAQDYDLCLRLSEVTEVRHIAKPLYLYRDHGNSISHQKQSEQRYFMREAVSQAIERRGLNRDRRSPDEKFAPVLAES